MVAQGLGVTVMTELCLRGKEQSGVCIYPITPELRRIVGVAAPKQTTPNVLELIKYIKTYGKA